MLKNVAILAAMLIPALAGDPVVAADTPRKEPSLPAIYSYRAANVESLRRGFTAPPREAGPWVYWMFFENVMAKEEITRELEEMAVAGIAGAELRFVSMHGFSGKPGPWFDPEGWARLGQKRLEFLSPEFIDALEHTCAQAKRLGRRVGTSWFAPHGLDLTGHVQPGRNQLRIDVPNILKNHLEPGEYTRPSGLLGSIRVRPVGRVFLQVTTP